MNQLINRMDKSRKNVFLGISLLLSVLAAMAYWFYWVEPEPFPAEGELATELNRLFPEANVSQIEDILFLDQRHAFVPHISAEGDRGFSMWRWRWHRWQADYIVTRGQPRLVKLDDDRPGSYHIIWHMHPADQVDRLHYYLIRKRHFSYSDNEELYLPSIQMHKEVVLNDKLYGVLPLPEEWVTVLETVLALENQHQRITGERDWFGRMFLPPTVYFSWLPMDKEGEETFPEHSVNGDTYSVGKLSVDYILTYQEDP